ncbi:iron complex outermembrane recepter protein [Pedobacter westerhofensis]|uniref:Iron complex outermembrane recepter protein n=2 Tax=Pedobacter westerhofensis TaxID=425512 RepID=A0A521FDA1_9SPHI|nr:iron complex outermembrane recepter protein [Pedobacter westerhofensis]
MQAQNLRLSGIIKDEQGQPLKGIVIYLYPASRQATTDVKGYFVFNNLSAGAFEIQTGHESFKALQFKSELRSGNLHFPFILHRLPHQLAEVTVKDKHIASRRQEESLNVEVVTADFIQRNLGGSLMKTLERLPGIKTIGIGSGQSKPLIRGLGFNRVVVVDKGVKHEGQQWGADHGLEIDQFAAGEVELIKGAASFVYGSDAIGGAIDIEPARVPAPYTLGGSVDLIGKTNNNLYGTSVNLYGRKRDWFFDARVTYQDYGDYRVPNDKVYVYDYAVNLHNNQLRNTAGTETGLHLNTGYINDRFRSIFYLSNTYSKSGFFANAHGLEPRRVDEVLHDASSRDLLMPNQKVNHLKLINHTEYQLPGNRLEMELGYQHNFRQEFSPYVNHGYMPPVYPADLQIPASLEREFDKRVYSINLRDNISLGRHEVKLGANLERQNNDIYGWSFLVPSFKQSSTGAFVYDKYKLSETVLLHGALRYDYGQINMFAYQDWFNSTVTTDGVTAMEKLTRAEDLSRVFNSLVWSAGLNYNPAGGFSLKANVGKSFRMPIAKELAANGVNYHYFSYERGNPALSPEQSYQADLSLAWAAPGWSVQLSPFYNYFPNYIYLNPTAAHDYFYGAGNQVFQYAQSRVERYGGELQLKYQLLKNLTTEVLAEYLYAKQLSGEKKGYTLPFSPPASALFNLTWSPKLKGRFEDSYFSIDYCITAAQNNIVPPEKKTPGYQIINLQAGSKVRIHKQAVMISLQAQNLLNTRYLNHTSFYRLIELPEAGRNIVLSLKVPFNVQSQTHKQQNN